MNFKSRHFEGNGRLAEAARNDPPMKQGEVGHAVRLLQRALIDLKYPMPGSMQDSADGRSKTPDGIYGGETRRKIWKFQVDEDLDKDGQAGEQTVSRMDELLVARKIHFAGLPPLPPGSPGNNEFSELNSQQAIFETLAEPFLRAVDFGIDWPGHFSKKNGATTATGVHIRGSRYAEIAGAVFSGRISVEADPALPRTMLYSQLPGNASKFKTQRKMTMSIDDMAIIVHEGTHAVTDMEHVGLIETFHDEALAFVAECLFFRKLMGSKRQGRSAADNKVYNAADAMAQTIISGQTTIDANDSDITDIINALKNTHTQQFIRSNGFS